jgi:chromosome segregation ATPase
MQRLQDIWAAATGNMRAELDAADSRARALQDEVALGEALITGLKHVKGLLRTDLREHKAALARAKAETGDWERENASLRRDITVLREQVSKFDGDGDGRVGGSKKKAK